MTEPIPLPSDHLTSAQAARIEKRNQRLADKLERKRKAAEVWVREFEIGNKTAEEAAKAAGVSKTTIYEWKRECPDFNDFLLAAWVDVGTSIRGLPNTTLVEQITQINAIYNDTDKADVKTRLECLREIAKLSGLYKMTPKERRKDKDDKGPQKEQARDQLLGVLSRARENVVAAAEAPAAEPPVAETPGSEAAGGES